MKGIGKILPIVFTIIILVTLGTFQDAEAGVAFPPSVTFTTPGDMIIEGNTIGGANIVFSVPITAVNANTGDLIFPVDCGAFSATGGFFPLGINTVNCSVGDPNGRGTANSPSFTVTVVDTTRPQLPSVTLTQFSNNFLLPIDFSAFLDLLVSDIVDPNPVIVHDAPSVFPIGLTTPITVTATDSSGNAASSNGFSVDVLLADSDGDGIVDDIDTNVNLISNLFNDLPEGTTGEIINRGGQTALIIFEEPDPDGIRFVNQPVVGDPAILQVCDNLADIEIDGDDSGIVTCGSVTIGILSGSVDASFTTGGPSVTTTMTPPDMLTYDPGTLTITNTGLSPAVITIDGVDITLLPGESTTILVGSGSGKSSTTAQDPNLGDVRHGTGHPNGFCHFTNCINVNGFFNHFPETTVPQGSTQTFTLLVNCPRGANTCNHIEIAGALPNSDFYEYQWAATVDRQLGSNNWVLTTNNPYGEIGEVTVAVQTVSQSYVSATFNIPFLIPGSIGTHDGIGNPQENNRHLHATVWANDGGMSNYIFNEGVYVDDIYAYPQVETSYDAPLEYEALCLNEDSTKRYTCAFDKVKQWTIKNAEEKLKEIYDERNYKTDSEID